MMTAVCFVVQSVYDFDPRVRRKAEALVDAGYSVDVLALRPEAGANEYVLDGVNVYTIGLGKKRGSLLRYFFEYSAFFVWALVKVPILMRRRRYAVVDVNTLPDFLIFAPIVARWMGAKLVLDMHEITPEFYISKYGIPEKSAVLRLLKFLERISFSFADHVITINEPVQELLTGRGLPISKSTVMMNAADEARFGTPADDDERRPSPTSGFVMVYHGTLTHIYGLDIAIDAFARARREMPDAEMWILGSGPEKERLAELARSKDLSERVKLVGQVSSREIPGWLRKSDAGILPIRRDALLEYAFPNKLPEYIISGKPVIISRLKAIRHYFSPEAVAFFEPHAVDELAAQMVRLYRDRTLRAQLVANASEEYRPIRWEVMKARYLNMIEALIGPTAHAQTSDAPERAAGIGH
jgi:glycosyltransferase involved in cell wall biosynthesis